MNHFKKIKKDTTNLKTSNKKLDEKNKHHISWKNHGIDEYIEKAFVTYLIKRKMM